MRIIDDQLVFDPSEVADFSPLVTKAISAEAESNSTDIPGWLSQTFATAIQRRLRDYMLLRIAQTPPLVQVDLITQAEAAIEAAKNPVVEVPVVPP
jgi:hypothetical protein